MMLRFTHDEADVLVTTTLIENGLDIPRANTIIVNRADRLGLAQLYQLRGRVGRSALHAYAYFLIPGSQTLSDTARRRLKALQEFSELGSGFRLAAADLEIRGAGEFLGSRQHGHIASLGFDLYCTMLEQAVAGMKGEPIEERRPVSLHLAIDVKLPESYMPDVGDRLALYKRLSVAQGLGRGRPPADRNRGPLGASAPPGTQPLRHGATPARRRARGREERRRRGREAAAAIRRQAGRRPPAAGGAHRAAAGRDHAFRDAHASRARTKRGRGSRWSGRSWKRRWRYEAGARRLVFANRAAHRGRAIDRRAACRQPVRRRDVRDPRAGGAVPVSVAVPRVLQHVSRRRSTRGRPL